MKIWMKFWDFQLKNLKRIDMRDLGILDFPEIIQKSFNNVETLSIETISNQIIENFEKSLISEKLFLQSMDTLEKGKRANIGEIREWKNGKFQRTTNGWKPVKENGEKIKVEESNEEKNIEADNKSSVEKLQIEITKLKQKIADIVNEKKTDIARIKEIKLEMGNLWVKRNDIGKDQYKKLSDSLTKEYWELYDKGIGANNYSNRKEILKEKLSDAVAELDKIKNKEEKKLGNLSKDELRRLVKNTNFEHLTEKEIDNLSRGFSIGIFDKEKSKKIEKDINKLEEILDKYDNVYIRAPYYTKNDKRTGERSFQVVLEKPSDKIVSVDEFKQATPDYFIRLFPTIKPLLGLKPDKGTINMFNARQFIPNHKNDKYGLTLTERVAIAAFTSSSFFVNKVMRYGTDNKQDQKDTEKYYEILRSALNKLPSVETVGYRGVRLTPEEAEEYKKGNIIKFPTVTSFFPASESGSARRAMDFATMVTEEKGKDDRIVTIKAKITDGKRLMPYSPQGSMGNEVVTLDNVPFKVVDNLGKSSSVTLQQMPKEKQ